MISHNIFMVRVNFPFFHTVVHELFEFYILLLYVNISRKILTLSFDQNEKPNLCVTQTQTRTRKSAKFQFETVFVLILSVTSYRTSRNLSRILKFSKWPPQNSNVNNQVLKLGWKINLFISISATRVDSRNLLESGVLNDYGSTISNQV